MKNKIVGYPVREFGEWTLVIDSTFYDVTNAD